MRWTIVLVLPILGGCIAPALGQDQIAIDPPVAPLHSKSEPQTFVPALTAVTKVAPEEVSLKPKIESFIPDASDAEEEPEFTVQESDPLLADDEALPEDVPDAETLADNLLLSGVGENPPQDEGVSIAPDISFDFPVVENEKVHYYINYFTGPVRKVFTRWLERSGKYLPLMQSIFEEEGLPLDLTYLAMVESGFNNRAYSWAHAAGPWQFIQSTGDLYGLRVDTWRDERRDFEKSTRAAARFLRHLYQRFDGNWYLAVASYNCGPARVERAIERAGSRDFWELSRLNLLPEETRNYVPKLLASLIISKQAPKYGFEGVEYMDPVAFDTVTVPSSTDLEVVARLCDVPSEEIKSLNPELKRWCTPPNAKNYALRLPLGTRTDFETAFAALPETDRAGYRRHKVRRGDTLKKLARRYNTRVEDLAELNRLSAASALSPGDEIVLPLRASQKVSVETVRQNYVRTKRTSYTVRRGESLYTIARKFGVTEKELRTWNKMGRRSLIRKGQKLTVVSSVAGSGSARSAKSDRGSRQVTTTYRVRSGDNLGKIAKRFGVTAQQLRALNGFSRRQLLRPGDRITVAQAEKSEKRSRGAKRKVRIVYHVKPGDTLWNISRRYDVADREIRNWNDLKKGAILKPGDRLTLMVENDQRG